MRNWVSVGSGVVLVLGAWVLVWSSLDELQKSSESIPPVLASALIPVLVVGVVLAVWRGSGILLVTAGVVVWWALHWLTFPDPYNVAGELVLFLLSLFASWAVVIGAENAGVRLRTGKAA